MKCYKLNQDTFQNQLELIRDIWYFCTSLLLIVRGRNDGLQHFLLVHKATNSAMNTFCCDCLRSLTKLIFHPVQKIVLICDKFLNNAKKSLYVTNRFVKLCLICNFLLQIRKHHFLKDNFLDFISNLFPLFSILSFILNRVQH